MKDSKGNILVAGDTVAFSGYSGSNIGNGTVIGFSSKKIRIETLPKTSPRGHAPYIHKHTKFPAQVTKISNDSYAIKTVRSLNIDNLLSDHIKEDGSYIIQMVIKEGGDKRARAMVVKIKDNIVISNIEAKNTTVFNEGEGDNLRKFAIHKL